MIHKHHVIEFRNGERIKTNDIVEKTIEEHAQTHHILYLIHRHWKDKIAWKSLSGQITHKEATILALKQAGYESSQKNRGKSFTLERRKNISLSKRGKTRSEASCLKQAKTNRKKDCVIIAPDGKNENIYNLRAYCITHGLNRSSLVSSSKNKINTGHKGYKLIFINSSKNNIKKD
jgi:hypothetical protein